MTDNIIYNSIIICLFTENFDNIKKKYENDIFKWENYEKVFNYLYSKLSEQNIELEKFVKYYYIYTFIYLNYTNYLAYISHPDITNENLEKIANKIKTSSSIVKNLLKYSHDEKIYKIIKLNDIFMSNKIKKKISNSNIQSHVKDYIFDLKQFDKISSLSNDNYKKILNLVIYRYVICKKNNYNNYHELYLKKIIGKNNIGIGLDSNKFTMLDFDNFIKQIPKSKKILNISAGTKCSGKIEIPIIKLINYIISKLNDEHYICVESETNIIITNKKFAGKIKINISDKFENIEFNQYQLLEDYKNFLEYKRIGRI